MYDFKIQLPDRTQLYVHVPRNYGIPRMVWGESRTYAEKLDALYDLDHISILDPENNRIKKIIRAKDFFRHDGDYRVSRGLYAIDPPKIHFCNSIDEMLKKTTGG